MIKEWGYRRKFVTLFLYIRARDACSNNSIFALENRLKKSLSLLFQVRTDRVQIIIKLHLIAMSL